MTTKYYIDLDGTYLGGFQGVEPPLGAIEVPYAPSHANDKWDGTIYVPAKAPAPTYAENRAAAYPSFADQFDLLYHGGIEAWTAAIQAVKNRYPKELL